jgi:hypothetical protein
MDQADPSIGTLGQPVGAHPRADQTGEQAGAPDPSPRREGERLVRIALGLALAPFVASAIALVVLVGGDYLPAGDLAMTEMHIRDVGRHEVLVGLHSRPFWSHPGPLQFYVVAPFYWLSGGSSIGMALGAITINGASVAAILTIARRRGGTPLLLCSLITCLLLVRSLGPEFLADASNLTITALPFLLLAFLTWSMFCGEWWSLPVGAFVVSFLVQSHVGFAVTAGPLLVCGATALGQRAWRGRGDRALWRRAMRVGALTGALLVLVWLPPLLEALMHSPSNAGNVFRYFRYPVERYPSLTDAWRVTTGQFGLTSEWLTGKLPMNLLSGESPYLYSSPLPIMFAPLAAAAIVVWRRARHGSGLVTTVVLLSGLVFVSIARTIGTLFDYRLRYTWVPPALAAVVILWGGWLGCSCRWPSAERLFTRVGVAAAAVLTAVTVVSAARAGTPHEDETELVAAISRPVIAAYAGADGPVVVDEIVSLANPAYSRALVLQLERHGIDTAVPAHRSIYFSPNRVHDGGRAAAYLVVATDDDVGPLLDDPHMQLLARWSPDPTTVAARAQREVQVLTAAWQSGEISDDEFLAQLRDAAAGHPETSATDVAVFVEDPPAAGEP